MDLSELVGILTLYHLCKEIESAYAPGAELLLYTHEPFLEHMSAIVEQNLGEPLYQKIELERYQMQLNALVGYFHPVVRICCIKNLQELYDRESCKLCASTAAEMNDIKRFMAQELSCKRFAQAAQNVLFRDLCKKVCPQFAHLSFKAFSDACSADKSLKKLHADISSQLHSKELLSATATALAECYVNGAARLRALLGELIPGYAAAIRLSVRPSSDVGVKLGISVIFGSKGTPLHNVLMITPQGIFLANKEKAEGDFKVYMAGELKLGYVQKNA